jgi:DNA-binding transcriptional regulator YiaG
LTNMDIRSAARAAGVSLYKIAYAQNVTECTLIRWLRKELSPDEKERYLSIIKKIKEEKD